jgi:hypothetical protein
MMLRTLATIVSGLALLASIAATIYLLNAPLYQVVETHCTESGCETIQGTRTLVEANGSRVIILLTLITLASGVPFVVSLTLPRLQRLVTWVFALLILAFSIIGSFTIGLAYMPSAILLLIAAVLTLFIRKDTGH